MNPQRPLRPWRDADRGVTAVVGVILLVAVTAALSGAVAVMVSVLTKEPDALPPKMGFQTNADGKITIMQADLGLDWGEFQFAVEGAPSCAVSLAGDPILASPGTSLGSPLSDVIAGESLRVSGNPGTSCVFSLVHMPTNRLILGPLTFKF